MQNWAELYKELADVIASIPAVKWVDLWHNQINFLDEEHEFPSPAVFLSFRILDVEDLGEKAQNIKLQIEVYVYYETFADTFKGAINQNAAIEYLELLTDIFKLLHSSGGANYNNMRRTGFSPVDTGSAGNLYQILFECTAVDTAAMIDYDTTIGNEVVITEAIPTEPTEPETPTYFIPD